jgi:hypothetical protein
MNRFGAFLVHLAISLVIFAVLAALVVYAWYPDFFFASDGGWQGIRIIVLVDLVLGPLLTLIVFDRRKPRGELTRDLGIIATFQLACLVAGTWVVFAERPLALVYVDGRFYTMSADDYRNAGVPVPDLSALPGPWPKRVVVELPEDPAAQSEIRRRALMSRRSLRTLVEHYQPLTFDALQVEREAFDPAELQSRDQQTRQLPVWLAEHGGSLEDYAFFPFGSRYDYIFLGLSRENGEILGLLRTPAPT